MFFMIAQLGSTVVVVCVCTHPVLLSFSGSGDRVHFPPNPSHRLRLRLALRLARPACVIGTWLAPPCCQPYLLLRWPVERSKMCGFHGGPICGLCFWCVCGSWFVCGICVWCVCGFCVGVWVSILKRLLDSHFLERPTTQCESAWPLCTTHPHTRTKHKIHNTPYTKSRQPDTHPQQNTKSKQTPNSKSSTYTHSTPNSTHHKIHTQNTKSTHTHTKHKIHTHARNTSIHTRNTEKCTKSFETLQITRATPTCYRKAFLKRCKSQYVVTFHAIHSNLPTLGVDTRFAELSPLLARLLA